MFDYLIYLFSKFFNFFFKFFLMIYKTVWSVFSFVYYKIIKLYFINGFFVPVLSNLFILPFVFVDNLLNVFTFLFLNTITFFYYVVKMLFNFFLNFFSDYLNFFLLPEFLLVFASMFSLLAFVYTKVAFNNDRFFSELGAVFGKESVERISIGSYEYTVLLRFHNAKKRLTALLYSWWVSFFLLVFSFFWLLISIYELYSVKLFHSVSSFFFKLGSNDVFFADSFYHDGFTQSARLFILLISIIFMVLYKFEIQNDSRLRRIEFLFLFLIGCSLSLFMVSSASLLSLFLSVEGLVMVMYVLTAGSSVLSGFPIVKILRFRAVEGALKYAITNAIATGSFLFGATLIFFFTGGELYFGSIYKILTNLSLDFNNFQSAFIYGGLLIGCSLIAVTFFFKLGLAPFHNWMADLYEASAPGVFAFFLIVPKAAILFTFLNLSRFFFSPFCEFFSILFLFFGLLSVVVGSVHALYQIKIERLLAYSSVAHAGGFLLLLSAVFFSNDRPFNLIVFFLIAYILVNTLFLAVFLSLRYSSSFFSHSYIKSFRVFSNLTISAQKTLTTVFFNLAGLPPFLGWFLKALILIVWVKVCFYSTSNFFVGSSLESLFDFSSINLSVSFVDFSSYVQITLAFTLFIFLTYFFNFLGLTFNNEILSFFCKQLSLFILIFFILFIFLVMVVSTFYYVRLINTIYGASTNSPLVLDKQGLLNTLSLDMAVLIFLLFFFNVGFIFFYSSILSYIDIFFIRFSVGF